MHYSTLEEHCSSYFPCLEGKSKQFWCLSIVLESLHRSINLTTNLVQGQCFDHSLMGLIKHPHDCEIMHRECKEWVNQGTDHGKGKKKKKIKSIYCLGQNSQATRHFYLYYLIFSKCENKAMFHSAERQSKGAACSPGGPSSGLRGPLSKRGCCLVTRFAIKRGQRLYCGAINPQVGGVWNMTLLSHVYASQPEERWFLLLT